MLENFKVFFQFFFAYLWTLNIIFIFAVIIVERKNPLYTLFWIFLIMLVPYFGFLLYLMFGLSFRKRRKANKIYDLKFLKSIKAIKEVKDKTLEKWESIITYLEMSSKNYITKNYELDFFYEGIDFFESLKKDLKAAKEEILMEYYIFRYDDLGKEILEILAERARNGVEVKLMVDAMYPPPRAMKEFCSKNNIDLNIFFKSIVSYINLRVNYRNHRKTTIIDNEIAYLGGMNIGVEYIGKGSLGYWKDLSARLKGDVVGELKREFYFSCAINDKSFKYEDMDLIEFKTKNMQSEAKENNFYAQIVSSGPNYEFRTGRDTILQLIRSAKKSILIQTPYFVPDDSVMDALKIAILTGVDVRIMIPYRADNFIVGYASRYYVKDFIEIGAKVYRYKKGFLHSKVVVIDEELCSFGTINFDYRSFYLNFEMNLNVYNRELSQELVKNFYRDAQNCLVYTIYDLNKNSYFDRTMQAILRLLAPIL